MSTPDFVDLVGAAVQLNEARRTGTPTQFITSTYPDLEWDDARAIARHCDRLRLDDCETQVGWKLGWTSEAMRTALGIDRPNWGTLWDSQVCNGDITLDRLIHPKIEPELVWRSPAAVPATITAVEVAAMGGEWALGLEVVDPRYPSFNFEALDNTADNSSSAAIQLGVFSAVDNVDIAAVELTFSNGSESRSGLGSQAMGSPWEAVAWLARSLADEGLGIEAGDIIFTGGLTAPFDAERGITYALTSNALPTTTLRFS